MTMKETQPDVLSDGSYPPYVKAAIRWQRKIRSDHKQREPKVTPTPMQWLCITMVFYNLFLNFSNLKALFWG